MTEKHKWTFSGQFKRNGFGWKSDLPIQRIKEALSEIKAHVKKEPVLAAEGAVLLLEKLSPALTNVDSSSGAIGSWVNRAIETLVPIIANAPVDAKVREKWLNRLWQAFIEDDMCYLDSLADEWGRLCATIPISSQWADRLLAERAFAYAHPPAGYRAYFKGIDACYSALYAAGRLDEVIALSQQDPNQFWSTRLWAVKALDAQGKPREAIEYAQATKEFNRPDAAIARACESILLNIGLVEEAYEHYALAATQSTTNLATFKAIVKKYPSLDPERILTDLVNKEPYHAGKWFATAKDAGYYGYAIHLTRQSPTDINTLARALRDFSESNPRFAFESGMAAMHWISCEQFYEITQADVNDIINRTMQVSAKIDLDQEQFQDRLQALLGSDRSGAKFLERLITKQLSG